MKDEIVQNCTKILYNTKDLQIVLGVGKNVAYKLMRSKNFPSIVIGGRYFVEVKTLEKWINQNAGSRIKI